MWALLDLNAVDSDLNGYAELTGLGEDNLTNAGRGRGFAGFPKVVLRAGGPQCSSQGINFSPAEGGSTHIERRG